MVMMLLKLSLCLCHQLFHHRIWLLDQFQKLCTAELFYRGCHDRRVRVLLTKHLYICHQLIQILDDGLLIAEPKPQLIIINRIFKQGVPADIARRFIYDS